MSGKLAHNLTLMMWLEAMMVCSLRQHVLPIFGLLMIMECIISLKLVDLHVPEYVPLDTRAQLSCHWQLGPADVLYSVKWYKDGKEFFRHVPRDLEQRRKFPLPGVDVEETDSSGSNITLRPAVLETGGRYRCEVSGERPLFPTVSDHADMVVVAIPEHGPIVSGFRARYRVGERVQVTCASGRSKPAVQLAWYINGEPAPSTAVSTATHDRHGALETTSLNLDFEVTELHFTTSGLKVKCLATLPPLYWRSNEESALKERTIHEKLAVHSYRNEISTRADRVHANQAQFPTSSSENVVAVICWMFLCVERLLVVE